MDTKFTEETKADIRWTLLVLVPIFTIVLCIFIGGCIQQIVRRIPFGEGGFSNTGLVLFLLGLMVLFAGLLLMLIKLKLNIIIDNENLKLRLFPIQLKYKTIPLSMIKDYKQIRLTIHQSISIGFHKKLKKDYYFVRGRDAIKFSLKNGKKIVVNTQKPLMMIRNLETLLNGKKKGGHNV